MAATAKKNKKYKNIEEAPAMMSVKDWCELNGVNEQRGYEWARREDTPTLKLGNRIIIPKHAYINWLNKQMK